MATEWQRVTNRCRVVLDTGRYSVPHRDFEDPDHVKELLDLELPTAELTPYDII